MAEINTPPGQVLLFSLPRTGCHLLEKMIISKQEKLKQCWHPHAAHPGTASFAMFGWLQNEDYDTTSYDTSADMVAEVEKGLQSWREMLEEAQKAGQTLYMHDHLYYLSTPERVVQTLAAAKNTESLPSTGNQNPTLIPQDLLLHPGTTPIITIRHPTLTVPSNYRAMDSLTAGPSEANTTISGDYACLRDLYDFYKANDINPIIVDADDYMTSEAFVRHICKHVPGLDPELAIVSWPKATEEEKKEMNPHLLVVQKSLINSEGLVHGRASKNLDLEAIQSKWAHEFGEERAAFFKKIANWHMPYYEYLRERRLRL